MPMFSVTLLDVCIELVPPSPRSDRTFLDAILPTVSRGDIKPSLYVRAVYLTIHVLGQMALMQISNSDLPIL